MLTVLMYTLGVVLLVVGVNLLVGGLRDRVRRRK